MQIRCKYCRGYMEDTDEVCPHCGGVNEDYKRNSYGVPETIEELQKWYTDHNLPPEEVTRFFIGKNYEGPRAFGIYKNDATGECIVYKNKSDGTRAIRYKGKDEAYAVNELYMKLKEEILHQKENNANNVNNLSKRGMNNIAKIFISIFVIYIVVEIFFSTFGYFILNKIFDSPNYGYYTYNDGYYYYLDGTWYEYNDEYADYGNGYWEKVIVADELEANYNDYYDSSMSYNYDDYGIEDFKATSYYQNYEDSMKYTSYSSDSDSDWDSGSSWDSSDSWDSSSSDWDSDW